MTNGYSVRLLFNGVILCLILSACHQQQTATSASDPSRRSVQAVYSSHRLKINITETAVYQLSLKDLQENGLDIDTIDAQNLHLSTAGTAVPYAIQQNSLIFSGKAPGSRYTAVRPYILTVGRVGKLVSETAVILPTDANSHTITLEENLIYESRARHDENAPVWFWHKINQGQQITLDVNLTDVFDGAGTLILTLWGFSDNAAILNDHEFDVMVNGRFIQTIRWDGATHLTTELQLPPNSLQNGNNEIILDNSKPGASPLDIFYLDKLLIQYQINPTTTNAQPIIKQPADLNLMRKSNWRSPAAGADFIIISTDGLMPTLAPLVAHRQAEGLQVATVPVAEIYDEFGFGEASPESIHDFLIHAATQWPQPRPHYVLLVGDATTDYHGYLTPPPVHHIPSPLVAVQYSGETVSDARLADIDGDLKPDLAIGRWPVVDKTAVSTLIERTIAYEKETATGNGHVGKITFAADPSEPTFMRMIDRIMANGQATITVPTTPNELQAAWQAGSWLTAYVGHGSLGRWGQINLLDANALKQPMPPIMLQFTCLTGLFAHPTQQSLSELMLDAPNGPTLIVGATSLTLSQFQEPFARNLIEGLQETPVLSEVEVAVIRMGDAFLQAKRDLPTSQSTDMQEISDTFVLFGDPTAHIVRP